ncbi:MAG TPA: energy transducer TonB [Vicinamibacterales bacterium]
MDAVTPILVQRAQPSGGLWSRIGLSAILHAVLLPVAAFVLTSAPQREPEPREVMTISLGGAPGPLVGGMTPMAGRAAVQAPPDANPTPPAPPPPKPPEMTLPREEPRPTPTPPRREPQPSRPPEEARGRRMPTAPQASTGNAVAETGGQGMQFGLTTGGGGTGGYLDVGNFCCPEYLGTMLQLIQRNWNAKQQVAGQTLVKYTIQRDGRITNVEIERSSGYFALDQTAQRAVILTGRLPPLPQQFTEPTLTVHLIFRYER